MGFAARRLPSAGQGSERFLLVLPSEIEQVGEAVEAVVDCCRNAGALSSRSRFRLRTVVAEALANAMCYGNRNDPSRNVTIEVTLRSDIIEITVSDEGTGFNPAAVRELRDEEWHESTCGRGLFMIRKLAQQVVFNSRGNAIRMTLPIQ